MLFLRIERIERAAAAGAVAAELVADAAAYLLLRWLAAQRSAGGMASAVSLRHVNLAHAVAAVGRWIAGAVVGAVVGVAAVAAVSAERAAEEEQATQKVMASRRAGEDADADVNADVDAEPASSSVAAAAAAVAAAVVAPLHNSPAHSPVDTPAAAEQKTSASSVSASSPSPSRVPGRSQCSAAAVRVRRACRTLARLAWRKASPVLANRRLGRSSSSFSSSSCPRDLSCRRC